jgi:hypothetical protein
MSSAKTLTYWVNACLSGSGSSPESMILVDHFTESPYYYPLTTDQMELIIGPDSAFAGTLT